MACTKPQVQFIALCMECCDDISCLCIPVNEEKSIERKDKESS